MEVSPATVFQIASAFSVWSLLWDFWEMWPSQYKKPTYVAKGRGQGMAMVPP